MKMSNIADGTDELTERGREGRGAGEERRSESMKMRLSHRRVNEGAFAHTDQQPANQLREIEKEVGFGRPICRSHLFDLSL